MNSEKKYWAKTLGTAYSCKMRGRQGNCRLKSEFTDSRSSSWLFQLAYLVKHMRNSWSWIPKNLIQVQKEKENFVVACLRSP